MSLFDSVKELTARGFYVFPLIPNSKLPVIKEYTDKASDDHNDLTDYWYDKIFETDIKNNIGIATSKFRGGGALLVVDVDNKKGKKGKPDKKGSDTILELELKGFEFPKTLTQKTPTGGYHLIYKINEPIKQGVSVLGDGLDIRSKGGYIVGAGSFIGDKKYLINSVPIAKAPDWIIQKCKEAKKRDTRKKKPTKKVSQKGAMLRATDYLLNNAPIAIEGAHGDQTTFVVANKLRDLGLTEDNCFNLMQDNWNDNCQPPWAPDELKVKVENAYSYGQNTPGADSPQADFEVISDDTEEMIDPVEELNKEYAFIVMGGKSTILRRNRKGQVSYMSVQAFHDLLKASTIQTGNGKTKQLSQFWMSSYKRATYDSVELLPGKSTPNGVYNLWRGFSCEPLAHIDDANDDMREGVRLFKEHALENVCSGNKKLYNWLMGYFAHLVQKPWEKPLTALVFKGKKGVGKNVLINRIGNLLGCHYKVEANKRYLLSNFNKHLENLLMFVLDECYWSGDKPAEAILKDLVTGELHTIEQKGREVYYVKNILRVVIIGNHAWVVPATEDERRFAIFNVGSKRRRDKKFFDPMINLIDKCGGNRLLLRELLDFDLSTVDVDEAPDSQGLLDQKIETLEPVHSWWYSSLKEGAILHLETFENHNWPQKLGREQVRNAFFSHAKQRGIKTWLPDAAQFGRKLNEVLPGTSISAKRDKETKQRSYAFPDLDECRNLFDKFIGHSINWEDTEAEENVIDAVSLFS